MHQAVIAPRGLRPCTGPVDPDVSARIDVLRIVLIGLIVICHGGRFLGSQVPFAGPETAFAATAFNRGLACLAVPLFFCISGYLLLRKLELTPAGYVGLLGKKFMAIGVPFLLFNGIWIVWMFTVGSIERFGSSGFLLQAGIVDKLLGWGTSPLNYPLWFLRELLKLFALTPVFLFLLRRAPDLGLAALALLWFAVSPGNEYGLCGFACCFYLGGWLARRGIDPGRGGRLDWLILPLFAAATAAVVLVSWPSLDPAVYGTFKKGYQLLGMVALWRLSSRTWLRDNALMHRLARYSFFIFLTHEPTVSLIQTRLLAIWQPHGSAAQLVAFFLPGLAAITGLYWLGRGLSHCFPRVFAVATGLPLRRVPPAGGRKTDKAGQSLSLAGSVAGGLLPPEALAAREETTVSEIA